MSLLAVESLWAGYSGMPAVRNVSFNCGEGQVVAILGPNGAGKTTTLLGLSGAIRPQKGRVILAGRDITGQPPQSIARRGMILVPDDRGLFPTLTVSQHLDLAMRSAPARRKDAARVPRQEILDRFPQLAGLQQRQCSLLSGGEQQMLAIAKALMLAPKVLLVDELSMGLAPVIVRTLLPQLGELARETGMGVVLVEQHYELALEVSTHALIMNHGEIVLAGAADDWLEHPEVVERAYFGASEASRQDDPVRRN